MSRRKNYLAAKIPTPFINKSSFPLRYQKYPNFSPLLFWKTIFLWPFLTNLYPLRLVSFSSSCSTHRKLFIYRWDLKIENHFVQTFFLNSYLGLKIKKYNIQTFFFNNCLDLKIENYDIQTFSLNSCLSLKIENRNIQMFSLNNSSLG